MLDRNAFRQLPSAWINEVTLHPLMGLYLSPLATARRNRRPRNRVPRRNYAREVMQLFSIGL